MERALILQYCGDKKTHLRYSGTQMLFSISLVNWNNSNFCRTSVTVLLSQVRDELDKTLRSITSHVTPFFPTRSSHSHWDFSDRLLRSVYFEKPVFQPNDSQKLCFGYRLVLWNSSLHNSPKPRDKGKVQAGLPTKCYCIGKRVLTCPAGHASLKCHASFKTLALS